MERSVPLLGSRIKCGDSVFCSRSASAAVFFLQQADFRLGKKVVEDQKSVFCESFQLLPVQWSLPVAMAVDNGIFAREDQGPIMDSGGVGIFFGDIPFNA